MEFSWTNALKFGVTTGLFASVLTFAAAWLRELWTERRKKGKDGAYLAMRLAVILERFVIRCIYRAWHDEAELADGFHELDCKLPALDKFPDDTDWKSLQPGLAERTLSLQNQIASAEMASEYAAIRENNKASSQADPILIGMLAWRLAHDLRSYYKLVPGTIEKLDYLSKTYELILTRRAAFQDAVNRRPS